MISSYFSTNLIVNLIKIVFKIYVKLKWLKIIIKIKSGWDRLTTYKMWKNKKFLTILYGRITILFLNESNKKQRN